MIIYGLFERVSFRLGRLLANVLISMNKLTDEGYLLYFCDTIALSIIFTDNNVTQ